VHGSTPFRRRPRRDFQQTMTSIEALTLRVREVRGDANPSLRISAPWPMVDRLIDEFEERGETAEIGCDVFGNCEFVRFGPHITVHVDDQLPADTFMVEIKSHQRDSCATKPLRCDPPPRNDPKLGTL
jgi:hypothetical protein